MQHLLKQQQQQLRITCRAIVKKIKTNKQKTTTKQNMGASGTEYAFRMKEHSHVFNSLFVTIVIRLYFDTHLLYILSISFFFFFLFSLMDSFKVHKRWS